MSDPYRTADGMACPRCRELLGGDADDQLVCPAGCGAWLPRAALEQLVDPAKLPRLSHAPFHRATPLPRTPCLACRRPLDDLYQGDFENVLTMGLCIEHGLWIERGDRATFAARYAGEIEVRRIEYAEVLRRRRLLADEGPVVVDLVDRVEALERTVAHLARLLEDLDRR